MPKLQLLFIAAILGVQSTAYAQTCSITGMARDDGKYIFQVLNDGDHVDSFVDSLQGASLRAAMLRNTLVREGICVKAPAECSIGVTARDDGSFLYQVKMAEEVVTSTAGDPLAAGAHATYLQKLLIDGGLCHRADVECSIKVSSREDGSYLYQVLQGKDVVKAYDGKDALLSARALRDDMVQRQACYLSGALRGKGARAREGESGSASIHDAR